MEEFDFDYWLFIAGLGVFLFGMYHLEKGLGGLAGRAFKRMLQQFTNKSWKGILTGASVTAILQSSSLVMLLVLAFLGGGMIKLPAALGVLMGANVGTTVTAWMVATLGFKINIANLSYPFLALGTLSYLMLDSRPVLKSLGSFLIGFGLLFLGLDYMKEAIEQVSGQFTLSDYGKMGLIVFLLIGLVITALIQSSSAMIVIVLSALNAHLIDIYQAVAIVIGANIGTTSTLVLASMKGSADKKRLALANVIFNFITGILCFIFLRKLIDLSFSVLHIETPLMELVFINTLLNVIGIVLFYPFLGPLGRLLNKQFKKSEPTGGTLYLKKVVIEVPDVAILALDQELKHIFFHTREFLINTLRIHQSDEEKSGFLSNLIKTQKDPLIKYNELKSLEDEVTVFYSRIQEQALTDAESQQLTRDMHKLRSMIYAAKSMKDVIRNIEEIDASDDILAKEILKELQLFSKEKINTATQLMMGEEGAAFEQKWKKDFDVFYHKLIASLYQQINSPKKGEVAVSTIVNVIKETIASLKDLYRAASTEFIENQSVEEITAKA
jgi:phosphate:Na+ symporter